MTLLTWSNLESVRENFGYPADGTVSAILFITGISWQRCLGAHLARMHCCCSSLGARGISILSSFFFPFFMPLQLKTTAENYRFARCDCGKLVKRTLWFLLRFTIVLNDILSQQHWQKSKLVGVCRPVVQILTLFHTKNCHFPHPFSGQT